MVRGVALLLGGLLALSAWAGEPVGARGAAPQAGAPRPAHVGGEAAVAAEEDHDDAQQTEKTVAEELAVGTPVEVKVDHGFSRGEARERVTYLLDYWNHRFGVKASWKGFRVFLSGRVWGIEVKAAFDVGDHQVIALSADPGGFLRRRAMDYVERKLRKYMSPTYDEP